MNSKTLFTTACLAGAVLSQCSCEGGQGVASQGEAQLGPGGGSDGTREYDETRGLRRGGRKGGFESFVAQRPGKIGTRIALAKAGVGSADGCGVGLVNRGFDGYAVTADLDDAQRGPGSGYEILGVGQGWERGPGGSSGDLYGTYRIPGSNQLDAGVGEITRETIYEPGFDRQSCTCKQSTPGLLDSEYTTIVGPGVTCPFDRREGPGSAARGYLPGTIKKVAKLTPGSVEKNFNCGVTTPGYYKTDVTTMDMLIKDPSGGVGKVPGQVVVDNLHGQPGLLYNTNNVIERPGLTAALLHRALQ